MSPLDEYYSYPFNADQTFQQGLANILSSVPNGESADDAILRATVFYFNRITGHAITVDEVKQSPQTASTKVEAQETLTFAQLKELIESGNLENIPNNKMIPESLNTETPSQSVAPPRKKPWESIASDS